MWDTNSKPEDIEDLSFERKWFSDVENNVFEAFSPKKLPVKLKLPTGFCEAESELKLLLKGKLIPPLVDSPPEILFKLNRANTLFNWQLIEGTSSVVPHEYHVWATEKKNNKPSTVVKLPKMDFDLKHSADFNLTITCIDFNSTGQFKVKLNSWDPEKGLPRNSSDWDVDADMNTTLLPDNVTEIEIRGNMEVEYVGFTTSGCLALAPNGLVVELKGDECEATLDGVCEHQSCYTVEGNECVFPFSYAGVTYKRCPSVDVYEPWCATGGATLFTNLKLLNLTFRC